MEPSEQIAALNRLIMGRCKRMRRDAAEVVQLAAQLEELVTQQIGHLEEDTDDRRSPNHSKVAA